MGPAESGGGFVRLEFTYTTNWAKPNPYWWQLEIAAGGAAVLRDFPEGQPRVQRANLGEQQVQLLADYLQAVDSTEWAPRYEALQLDGGEYTLLVTTSQGTSSVFSSGFEAPPTLWVLQEALFNIKSRAHWHEAP